MVSWGIDLGTTNSCISRVVAGKATAVTVDEARGKAILPSVVLFGPEGTVVGREAHNLELTAPACCVRSVKRRMGRGPSYTIGERSVSPEEVSAEILSALKRAAEQTTGEQVRDVVITVPAYFDDVQRRATLRAGELAGLNVLRLLNEPTSASLVYDQAGSGPTNDSAEIAMIYDLGGGTFDVSVLEMVGEVREVRATAGNSQLGGDDFDELLYRRFADHLKHERGVDVGDDPRACAKLRTLAEQTKIALSSALEHRASAEFVTVDSAGAPVHLDLTIARREFEDLIEPLLRTTIDLARRALDEARLEQPLSRICLVGGSTRVPMVRTLLAEAFDAEVHEEVDPELAVALGGGVQAALLAGEPLERVLVDVAAHSLGVRVRGADDMPWESPDTFGAILRRNTVLPASRCREFYTAVDDQERLRIEVFQGESARCSQNRPVGTFELDIEPMPAHSPIAIDLAYDLDGVVRVTASQTGTDRGKSVELRLSDSSEAGAVPDSSVLRKARALLDELDAEDAEALRLLVERYERATSEERPAQEDQLLDFILELEDQSAHQVDQPQGD